MVISHSHPIFALESGSEKKVWNVKAFTSLDFLLNTIILATASHLFTTAFHLFVYWSLGHIWQCRGLTTSSVLRDLSWWTWNHAVGAEDYSDFVLRDHTWIHSWQCSVTLCVLLVIKLESTGCVQCSCLNPFYLSAPPNCLISVFYLPFESCQNLTFIDYF